MCSTFLCYAVRSVDGDVVEEDYEPDLPDVRSSGGLGIPNQYKTCMDRWRSNRDDTAGFFEVAASEAETYAAEGAWSDVHDSNTKGLNLSTLVERLFSWQPVFSVGVFGR